MLNKTVLSSLVLLGVCLSGCQGALSGAAGSGGDQVTIVTPPNQPDQSIYQDANGDGANSDDEFVGILDIFLSTQAIELTWPEQSFAEGENGSYRVTVWINPSPLVQPPAWQELYIAHHFADNPAGTHFILGPFGYQPNFCTYCPIRVTIEPETYVYNESATPDPFVYSLVDGPQQESESFILSMIKPASSNGKEPEETCINNVPPFESAYVISIENGYCIWGTIESGENDDEIHLENDNP